MIITFVGTFYSCTFSPKKYSELQNYWDSDTFVVVLALYSSTLDWKFNSDYEVKVQTQYFRSYQVNRLEITSLFCT